MSEAPRCSRRSFVARLALAAGVASPLVALLDGEPAALARGEETDLAVLYAAIALEHQAIALYDLGLRRGLVPAGLRDYAIEFRGDHEGHRDTQIAIAEERGGRPPAPLSAYEFGALAAGDRFLRHALEVEGAAQRAYATLLSRIRSSEYLLSAAFVLIDEVRHVTVWRRVLGLKVY
ncbi:MAG TPA: DUF4439 domain-containing protein [Vicinamibacteria bacterium]